MERVWERDDRSKPICCPLPWKSDDRTKPIRPVGNESGFAGIERHRRTLVTRLAIDLVKLGNSRSNPILFPGRRSINTDPS
jgi:hypothetical protein